MYKSLLLLDLETNSTFSFTDSSAAVDKIPKLLIGHSLPLIDTRLKPSGKRINMQFMSNFRLTLKFMARSRGLSLASVRPSLHHAVRAVIAINYMARDQFSISYC